MGGACGGKTEREGWEDGRLARGAAQAKHKSHKLNSPSFTTFISAREKRETNRILTNQREDLKPQTMPVRRGHVAPQNTFLDTIIRKFEGQSK